MKIKKDEKLKEFAKHLRNGSYAIDIQSIIDEVKTMQSGRLLRNYKYKLILEDQQKTLVEAALQNQRYRSRCVELRIKTTDIQCLLKAHLSALRKHLKSTYASVIKSRGYTTISARDEYIDSLLVDGIRQLQALESLEKILILVIDDIDKAAFTIKEIVEVFKINAKREVTL